MFSNIELILLQISNSNIIRFYLPTFVNDVILVGIAYLVYNCGASDCFIPERFFDTCQQADWSTLIKPASKMKIMIAGALEKHKASVV
jgi:hypothetical protein